MRPVVTFGDGRIFDPKVCLMATMECEKHERFLQDMCDLLKDIQTDIFITEKGIDDLLARQMSQPYNPEDRLFTDVVDSKSTVVSDVNYHLDHSADKPLRRVRPWRRQQSEPDSPNQMMMSKLYFRSMSNPCVCIPNLSSRLMKFDKQILSFRHKIDEIASKINHVSQIKESGKDIERAITLESSFVKTSNLTCRCCSNCVWIIRMFSGTSLRKIQNLKRQSLQQRSQLMKLTNDSTVKIESPPLHRKDFMFMQLHTTTESTTRRHSQDNGVPNYNLKPVTVSGVHDSYRMLQKQEEQISQPPALSSPGNQPWYSHLASSPGNEHWQQQHVLSPKNIPWHPPPVSPPSNLPWQPPMVPPPVFFPGQGNTPPPFHPSPPPFGPRSREPVMTRGSSDVRRQCIAPRDEDPLHVLSVEMLDHHVGMPFGGNSLQDQDLRHLPPFEVHNRCPTPPDHQRRYYRNYRDHNYRPFARHPFRHYRHSNRNFRSDRHQSPGSLMTHNFSQPLPEGDFTSRPSQSSPLMSSSPNRSLSHPAHEQNMDPTSPFFASRSGPVGQEMTASATCDFPSSRPSWIHTDHQKDHYKLVYTESNAPPQGTTIPAIISPERSAPAHAVRHPSVGSNTILVSPRSSRSPRNMVQDTVTISSPSLNGPNRKTTDYIPTTSPLSRLPTNKMTECSTPSKQTCLMLKPGHFDTDRITPQQIEQTSSSTQDTRLVIDETVNVKTCSTFSFKSFNPLHKARKFMTKCKELTSRKRQIKLGDTGSSPWQQEDGFQWVELNGKGPSPSSTMKEEMLKGLGLSPPVEQGLKSPSYRRSSQAKPTVSTPSSKTKVADSSPNLPISPRPSQSVVKKTSGAKSPKTPSSPRVRQSIVKKTPEGKSPKAPVSPRGGQSSLKKTPEGRSPKAPVSPRGVQSSMKQTPEGRSPKAPVSTRGVQSSLKKTPESRSPKAPVSPRGVQSSVKKTPEGRSPKAPVSPRGIQSRVKKTPEGRSPKMPSSPRVSQRIMKKMKAEDVSMSDPLGMTDDKDGTRMTRQDESSAEPSILTSKKSCKPGQRPPSREDIELCINSVKNGALTESGTSSSPAVLRLPLKFKRNEPSSDLAETINIPTEQPSPRMDTCSSSEHFVTSPIGGSRSTKPQGKILPQVQPEHSTVPGDMKSQELSPVHVWRIPRSKASTPESCGQSTVTSLASSPGPVRRIAPKPQFLATYTLPVTLSVSPTVPAAKENLVVTLTPASATRVNAIQTCSPKPQMSIARINQQVETLQPSNSSMRHVQLLTSDVTTNSRKSQTMLPENPEPVKSTQWISRPSKVSLIPPRLVMKITKNAEMTDTYRVSSIQTTAGTSTFKLTDVKYGQRSTSVPVSSSTSITTSVVVTSPYSTLSQTVTTSQEIATIRKPTTRDASTLPGYVTRLEAATSQQSASTFGTSTSLETVASFDKTCDSGSSTPDRLVIVTNGNLDDEFDIESRQPAASLVGPSIRPVLLDNPTSAVTKPTVTNSLATVMSVSEQSSTTQKETPSPKISGSICSVSRLRKPCDSNSSVPFGKFVRTSGTSTSAVNPSSLSRSSSKNLPGWTTIELPAHSSKVPSQVTRNKMFLSSKLSGNVPDSLGPVSVRPHAKDDWKQLLTERTMTEVMSSIGVSSKKSDSHKAQKCSKIVTDVKMTGNPSKWPDVNLRGEDTRCCDSVKDILAEETLNKNLQQSSPKVHISRKRLRPDISDVNWVIQDKEYISSHEADYVGTPPKRRQWSIVTKETPRTVSSEIAIQSGGNVSNNQSHDLQDTSVTPVDQKKYTPVKITYEEKPSALKSVRNTSASQKKPLGKVVPTKLTVQCNLLQKLRDTPPIAFKGKIYEKKVRDILLFSKVCVKNAYDYHSCRILPAAIATASSHVSPRYFARELVFMIFTIGELQGKKIESQSRRNPLIQSQILNPTKISAVKDVVLHRFPIEELHWSERCIPFINDSLKTLFQRKLTHSAFQWIEGIQDCF